MESANECGGVSFCCGTLGFVAVVFDENLHEMRWLREAKKAELFAVLTGTEGHGPCPCGQLEVLVVYGRQSQLEMKEKKHEELYNACTKILLRMGNLPTFMVGDFQRDASGTSRQLMIAKTQHLLFDIAEQQSISRTKSWRQRTVMGNMSQGWDYVFANTAALRTVRRFELSQEQVVTKHKLLMVESDLEMYTATPMVMGQVKLDLTRTSWTKTLKRIGRERDDTLWKCVTDVLLVKRGRCSAMLTRMLPEATEQEDDRRREGTRACARTCVPKADARFTGEVDVQIRKRKKLIDQIRSMSDVWKKIEWADFGVKPSELREERWNKLRQKGITLFPTMSELWRQSRVMWEEEKP